MVGRDFSGDDVMKALVNKGDYWVDRVTGSHYILKWEAPDDHDTDNRTVSVPRHDRLKTGTLKKIMEQAGGTDFQTFCEWVDRNS